MGKYTVNNCFTLYTFNVLILKYCWISQKKRDLQHPYGPLVVADSDCTENENEHLRLRFTLPLLISNDLDGHHLICLVIQTLQDLAKRSFPNHLQHFIAIAYMVMQDLHRVFRGRSQLTNSSAGLFMSLFTVPDFLLLGETSQW